MKKVLVFLLVVMVATVSLFANGAQEATAAKFPNGDVSFIIPNSAGGGNDLCVRAMIPVLQNH